MFMFFFFNNKSNVVQLNRLTILVFLTFLFGKQNL